MQYAAGAVCVAGPFVTCVQFPFGMPLHQPASVLGSNCFSS